MRLDFAMNFGISMEAKKLFVSFLEEGGSFAQAKSSVFEPTETLMLLKLHRYFNWADKKLHTAFFIENKDQINPDLLADFKSGGTLEVKPGLAKKQQVKVEVRPKGLVARDDTLQSKKDILFTGIKKADIVDVNSESDFPMLGMPAKKGPGAPKRQGKPQPARGPPGA